MKRRVAVFTGSRAEYGLLHWLMKDIQASDNLDLQVIVSGMHMSPEFGETWKQVEEGGFRIDAKVEMLLSSNSRVGVVKSMGLGTIGFADALERLAPDVLVLLGDRFEALSVAQAALVMKVPIAHLHGGEITEGAYDDAIRHAITKMSSLHFTSAEPNRRRVIQMGESPDTVFNVGALGVDHLLRTPRMNSDELAESLNFTLRAPYFLVTYHPATLADEDPAEVCLNLLAALDRHPDHQVVLTYPNADNGGRAIIPLLEEFMARQPQRVCAVPNLGFQRYVSVAADAAAVIGNSSSGIIEAPAFGVPTVDIGARQSGRLSSASVLHTGVSADAIDEGIRTVLARDFRDMSRTTPNPYGSGQASGQILRVLEGHRLVGIKRFHDLNFQP